MNANISFQDIIKLNRFYDQRIGIYTPYPKIYAHMDWRPDQCQKLKRYHFVLRTLRAPLRSKRPGHNNPTEYGYDKNFVISKRLESNLGPKDESWAEDALCSLALTRAWIKGHFPSEYQDPNAPWAMLDWMIRFLADQDVQEEADEKFFHFWKGKHRRTDWKLLQSLWAKIGNGRMIRFEYFNRQKNCSESIVDHIPLRLLCYHSTWYLLACAEDGRVRRFSVDCIGDLHQTGQCYDPKHALKVAVEAQEFGIFENLSGIKRAKIQFSEHAWRWVKDEIWHSTQIRDDQQRTLEFEYGHDEELVRTILSYGHEIIDLQPDELQQKVVERAKALIQNLTKESNNEQF